MIKAQLEIKIPRSSLCLVSFLSPLGVIKRLRVSFLFYNSMILLGYKSIQFFQPCENNWRPANGICGVWYCPNHPKPINLGTSKFVLIPTVHGSRPAGRAIEYISIEGYERSVLFLVFLASCFTHTTQITSTNGFLFLISRFDGEFYQGSV